MRRHLILYLCVAVSAASIAAHTLNATDAYAQDVVVEGPGHELSPGTVAHTSASVETGVDSNVFYEDANPNVSPLIRLIARVALASQENKQGEETVDGLIGEPSAEPGAPTLDWRLGGELRAEQYISSESRISDRSNIGGRANLHLVVFPEGITQFSVDDRFIRDTRPQNFETRGNLNRDINHLRLGLKYQPGGGALGFGLRYENTIDRFESSASSFANRIQHLVGARAEWQILPITRISMDASFGLFDALGSGTVGGVAFKNSSAPLRVQVGVATALTERSTIRARVGYGNGFYSAAESFANVIGSLELGVRYSEQGRFTVAYEYDFKDSLNANFYRDHAIVARLDQQIDLLLLSAGLDVRLRGYRGIPMSIGPASRDDFILHAGIHAQYLFRDWLAATAQVDATTDQTDYTSMGGGFSDDPSYSRVETTVGATAAF